MGEEETSCCGYCAKTIDKGDAVYDERRGAYYCDIDCFRSWADDNVDDVIEYYERMNVHE